MNIEIKTEIPEELKEVWANISGEERSELMAKVLLKTAQDIKAEDEKQNG